jgi:putative transposase
MLQWQESLRVLWNLAHEQRLMGLRRHVVRQRPACRCGAVPTANDGGTASVCGACGAGLPYPRAIKGAVDERVFVQYLRQQAELPALRAMDARLADVPCAACQAVLRDLDKAWQRAFKSLCGQPKWKAATGRQLSMFAHATRFSMTDRGIKMEKLGVVAAVLHRPLPGTIKSVRIQRDVDQWFAVIACEATVPDPAPHPGPAVGIDRGVVNVIADSDGRLVKNFSRRSDGVAACGGSGVGRPVRQEAVSRGTDRGGNAGEEPNHGHLPTVHNRIVRLQRKIERQNAQAKADGREPEGANVRKARERLARLHRKVRRQRSHFLHVESKRYADRYGTVAVEKLEVKAMTASAGRHARQKAGLNRSILSVGWSMFLNLLKYKADERGGRVVEVPAAYSSQTCHGCGHVSSENRQSQAEFECVACGLFEHADVNAAKVILQRALAGRVSAPRAPRKSLWTMKRRRKSAPGAVAA